MVLPCLKLNCCCWTACTIKWHIWGINTCHRSKLAAFTSNGHEEWLWKIRRRRKNKNNDRSWFNNPRFDFHWMDFLKVIWIHFAVSVFENSSACQTHGEMLWIKCTVTAFWLNNYRRSFSADRLFSSSFENINEKKKKEKCRAKMLTSEFHLLE